MPGWTGPRPGRGSLRDSLASKEWAVQAWAAQTAFPGSWGWLPTCDGFFQGFSPSASLLPRPNNGIKPMVLKLSLV